MNGVLAGKHFLKGINESSKMFQRILSVKEALTKQVGYQQVES